LSDEHVNNNWLLSLSSIQLIVPVCPTYTITHLSLNILSTCTTSLEQDYNISLTLILSLIRFWFWSWTTNVTGLLLYIILVTAAVCPVNVVMQSPLSMSKDLQVLSSEHVNKCVLSAFNCISKISFVCPVNSLSQLPVCSS